MANGGAARYDREHLGVIRRVRVAVGLVVLLLLVFTLVLGLAIPADGGMAPDHSAGRPVLFLRLDRDYGRGEVICLRLPDGQTVLRRVVAVAGDTVELRDGVVYINGLAERGNYSITRTAAASEGPSYPLLLHQGEFFVLADRREIMTDSRSLGLLSRLEILGRVLG